MATITISGHEPGDYIHPDQRVEVVDEATGGKYELYLRSNAMKGDSSGEVTLVVPINTISEINADTNYLVVTLSYPGTNKEAEQRKQLFAGTSIGPGRRELGKPPRRREKSNRSLGSSKAR